MCNQKNHFLIFSMFFIKDTHTEKGFKTDINKKYHEKELSSENKDVSSLNGKCTLVIALLR